MCDNVSMYEAHISYLAVGVTEGPEHCQTEIEVSVIANRVSTDHAKSLPICTQRLSQARYCVTNDVTLPIIII